MIRKIMTADEAVADIHDGASVMVGGFLGQELRRFLWMLWFAKGLNILL